MSRWNTRKTAFEVKAACMGILISRELWENARLQSGYSHEIDKKE